MSTIKDYSIIETDAMLDLFDICERVNNGDTDFKALRQRLLRIKSKLKPLTPIVENAYDAGMLDRELSLSFDIQY
jgi:hypothetical protein